MVTPFENVTLVVHTMNKKAPHRQDISARSVTSLRLSYLWRNGRLTRKRRRPQRSQQLPQISRSRVNSEGVMQDTRLETIVECVSQGLDHSLVSDNPGGFGSKSVDLVVSCSTRCISGTELCPTRQWCPRFKPNAVERMEPQSCVGRRSCHRHICQHYGSFLPGVEPHQLCNLGKLCVCPKFSS